MISVEEAQKTIMDLIPKGDIESISLKDSVVRILAKPVEAAFDLPSHDNSAMDGYAVRTEDIAGASAQSPVKLHSCKVIAAGDQPLQELSPGHCARIFTGALVPQGANAVIMQEDVSIDKQKVIFSSPAKQGTHIRRRGEECQQGDCIFEAGHRLSPASVGVLANFGCREVSVYQAPRIGIAVTGSEIISDPKEWKAGKIFDSNSFALNAALKEMHLQPVMIKQCSDDRKSLLKTLGLVADECDFVIVTGGVSVGDFDFVKEVSNSLNFEQVFWKVKQKPGKPIYFGKSPDKFLFGLPGNPASALVCFYEYVMPALKKSMGYQNPFLTKVWARLKYPFEKKAGRAHFIRAQISFNSETPSLTLLKQQGSHIMTSFASANCLAVIPEEINSLEAGAWVETHLLEGHISQGEN
jgi:molybdopterin molybdotransferase